MSVYTITCSAFTPPYMVFSQNVRECLYFYVNPSITKMLARGNNFFLSISQHCRYLSSASALKSRTHHTCGTSTVDTSDIDRLHCRRVCVPELISVLPFWCWILINHFLILEFFLVRTDINFCLCSCKISISSKSTAKKLVQRL